MDTIDYAFICFVMVDFMLVFAFMCFGSIEKKYKAFVSWLVLSLLSIVLLACIVFWKLHPFCKLDSYLNLNWLYD